MRGIFLPFKNRKRVGILRHARLAQLESVDYPLTGKYGFKTVNGKEACTTQRCHFCTRSKWRCFKTVNGKEACTTCTSSLTNK